MALTDKQADMLIEQREDLLAFARSKAVAAGHTDETEIEAHVMTLMGSAFALGIAYVIGTNANPARYIDIVQTGLQQVADGAALFHREIIERSVQ